MKSATAIKRRASELAEDAAALGIEVTADQIERRMLVSASLPVPPVKAPKRPTRLRGGCG